MKTTYNTPIVPNGSGSIMPGGLTTAPIDFATSATASKLSFDFSLDRMPTNGNYEFWAFQFYTNTGRVGYIGFQNNGNLLTQYEVGPVVNFAIWNTSGGTAGPNGQVGSFDHEGDGMRAPSRLSGFVAGHTYTTTLTVSNGIVTAYVLDKDTGVNTLIGTINIPAGETLKSDGVTFTEIYMPVASASAVMPVTATWSNFKANDVAGTFYVSQVNHDSKTVNAGIDYVTEVTATSLAQMTGGTGGQTIVATSGNDKIYTGPGNNTYDLGAGNDTVYLGTGSATINGNAGTDTAVESKTYASYTVVQSATTATITDKATSSVVSLTNFESVQFADKTVSLSTAPVVAPVVAAVAIPTKASEVITSFNEPHAKMMNYFLLTVAPHTSDIVVHFNTVDSGRTGSVATAGVDYTANETYVTLKAGTNTASFGVEILPNNYAEAAETIAAHVQFNSGGTQIELVAVHTINAHDAWTV